jgi:hypothetical protein
MKTQDLQDCSAPNPNRDRPKLHKTPTNSMKTQDLQDYSAPNPNQDKPKLHKTPTNSMKNPKLCRIEPKLGVSS